MDFELNTDTMIKDLEKKEHPQPYHFAAMVMHQQAKDGFDSDNLTGMRPEDFDPDAIVTKTEGLDLDPNGQFDAQRITIPNDFDPNGQLDAQPLVRQTPTADEDPVAFYNEQIRVMQEELRDPSLSDNNFVSRSARLEAMKDRRYLAKLEQDEPRDEILIRAVRDSINNSEAEAELADASESNRIDRSAFDQEIQNIRTDLDVDDQVRQAESEARAIEQQNEVGDIQANIANDRADLEAERAQITNQADNFNRAVEFDLNNYAEYDGNPRAVRARFLFGENIENLSKEQKAEIMQIEADAEDLRKQFDPVEIQKRNDKIKYNFARNKIEQVLKRGDLTRDRILRDRAE